MDLLKEVNKYLEDVNIILSKIDLKDEEFKKSIVSLKRKGDIIQEIIKKQETKDLIERICIFNVVINNSKKTLELEVFKDYLGRLGVTQEEVKKIIADNEIDKKILAITEEYCKHLTEIAEKKKSQNE